ncbi:MAG TPA: saccharopine dehydrogenase C-terminal domain-containing protein [Aridibacter sp.]|nr:saccharopine dehydrogenase C-terminal domain-containing protein [Aridibacter sp.]
MVKRIFIAGTGGIGRAAAVLLREWSETEVELYLGDVSEEQLDEAYHFITRRSDSGSGIVLVQMPAGETTGEMRAAFDECDVLLDCAPGGEAPRLAEFAKEHGMHYANLTEYVAETDKIIELAEGADTGFILQTGLAPGFINVLAVSLYNRFVEEFGNANVEKIAMKVGALTAHAHAPHFYGFTWSPIGVATEYVKNSRVVRDHRITELPALSEREAIVIGGRRFDADLTSGGAADLPERFASLARTLDYKTLRHVGHFDWASGVIHEFANDEDLPQKVLERFLREIPAVEDDFVLAHASVEGFDSDGVRRLLEKAYFVNPIEINGNRLRAIQTTTAAPLCEAAMMLISGRYKGVILQSAIDPAEFLGGRFVSRIFV